MTIHMPKLPPMAGVCSICEGAAEFYLLDNKADFNCRICGKYEIETSRGGIRIPDDLQPYLSAATRQTSERGHKLTITCENLGETAEAHQRTSTAEKLDKVLEFIAAGVKRPGGKPATLNTAQDYPIADAYDRNELLSYLLHLHEQQLIIADITYTEYCAIAICVPTMKGWQHCEPIRSPGGEPGRCFIASWLDDQMDEPYNNGIDPAVRDCGYTPIWMKSVPENKGITDRIISEVRRAEFVVADLTGQRPNVYFEAGLARGLGREVIWSCRADHVDGPDGLHFDIRHFGHVVWHDSAELRTKLKDSIRANIIRKS
jgi:hypothetical protein